MPKLRREVRPNYTPDAMGAKQQGLVFLEALVTADGAVGTTRVLYGIHPSFGLDDQAVRAVSQWRFEPGTAGGRPVPLVVPIEVSFRLE